MAPRNVNKFCCCQGAACYNVRHLMKTLEFFRPKPWDTLSPERRNFAVASVFGLAITVLFYLSYLPLSANLQIFPLNYFLSPALPGIYLAEFFFTKILFRADMNATKSGYVMISGAGNYFFWGMYGIFLNFLRQRQYEFGWKSACFSVLTFFVSVASMTYALQIGMDLDDPSLVQLIFFCGLLLGMLSMATIYAALANTE